LKVLLYVLKYHISPIFPTRKSDKGFFFAKEIKSILLKCWSWDRAVGVATGYRLDSSLEFESRRGKNFLFSTASRPVLGPIKPPNQ
jgi:hypothetical protein